VLGAVKANTLDFEFFSNQRREVDAGCNDISAWGPGRAVRDLQCSAKGLKDFERKESDLSLIILAIIKVSISPNSMSCHAFDLRHFDRGMFVRRALIVAEEVVARRNIEMTDFHFRNHITSRPIVTRRVVAL